MSISRHFRQLLLFFLPFSLLVSSISASAAEPKWIRINSSHFSVLTDGGQKKGLEVVLRLEQMRVIFEQLLLKNKLVQGVPLEVIAVNSDKEYAQIAPLRQGQPVASPGFFVTGEPDYIVLDLEADESWRAVSRDFALVFLTYNYPPSPGWFDEGCAEYFSSLRLDKKQAQLGSDPALTPSWQEDLIGNQVGVRNPPKSFTELLSGPVWLPLPDLFTVRHNPLKPEESARHTLFYAESWIVMHYLLNKNKLPQTGTYLDLVQNQQVPVDQAIQQAYGMTPAQMEKEVKDYFNSLTPLFMAMDAAKQPGTQDTGELRSFPVPLGPDDIGTSVQDVSEIEAKTVLAEAAARLPEHREQALKSLEAMVANPMTETASGHRALAWIYMTQRQFDQVPDELDAARRLDARDPWIKFYAARSKYEQAVVTNSSFEGLSNMIQDLRAVIDWNPEFAEAYHLLALARLEGGGVNSALASIREAIRLSPRNQTYLLNLARIYMEGKKWDDATALLERLKHDPDPQIAQGARKDLEALPVWKKYGIPPEQQNSEGAKTGAQTSGTSADQESSDSADSTPEPQTDNRKVEFIKGKLLSVDCSQAPAALLTLNAAARTMKLRTQNYKSLLVIGADEFSCAWKNVAVAVNYKANGKAAGDLVSIEVQ